MLKIENTEVIGWEASIRGMRNPMNSWEKSDSGWSSNWPYTLSLTNNVLRIDNLSEEDAVQLACIFTDHGIGICLLPRKE